MSIGGLLFFSVFAFLLPAVLSLFLQKFDFLNNILNKTLTFILSLGLSAYVWWYYYYNDWGTDTYQHFISSLVSAFIQLVIFILCAYLVNALLSKFNFSFKNKTFKSTLSSSIFITTIAITTLSS